MGFAQWRQRPRNARKLAIGMLSYQAIGCSQAGQNERGETTERSRGIR